MVPRDGRYLVIIALSLLKIGSIVLHTDTAMRSSLGLGIVVATVARPRRDGLVNTWIRVRWILLGNVMTHEPDDLEVVG